MINKPRTRGGAALVCFFWFPSMRIPFDHSKRRGGQDALIRKHRRSAAQQSRNATPVATSPKQKKLYFIFVGVQVLFVCLFVRLDCAVAVAPGGWLGYTPSPTFAESRPFPTQLPLASSVRRSLSSIPLALPLLHLLALLSLHRAGRTRSVASKAALGSVSIDPRHMDPHDGKRVARVHSRSVTRAP